MEIIKIIFNNKNHFYNIGLILFTFCFSPLDFFTYIFQLNEFTYVQQNEYYKIFFLNQAICNFQTLTLVCHLKSN